MSLKALMPTILYGFELGEFLGRQLLQPERGVLHVLERGARLVRGVLRVMNGPSVLLFRKRQVIRRPSILTLLDAGILR
jgi:hypothetical protein